MDQFNLYQRYQLTRSGELTLPDMTALTTVYLPIIGAEALTLYITWMTSAQHAQGRLVQQHTELVDQIGLNQQSFLTARRRLESLGLVQTYRQTLTQGTQWAYELHRPMTMNDFLADPTLASLLHHYVGEKTMTQIVALNQPPVAEPVGDNVSQTFFDLIDQERFMRLPKAPAMLGADKATNLTDQLKAHESQLDLMQIQQMLASYNIPTQELRRHAEQLELIKSLYGIDDMTLVRGIQKHLTVDQEINVKGLQNDLKAHFRQGEREAKPVDDPYAGQNEEPAVTPKQPSGKQDAKAQLVEVMQKTAPIQFLHQLREKKGGFVGDNELKALEDLSQVKGVQPEMLNVLIYHLTIVEQKATLNRGMLQAIMNDWLQANVKTAPEALRYLQKRQNTQARPTTNPTGNQKHRRAAQGQIRERRPDWEKQTVEAATPEQIAQAQAKAEARRERRQNRNQSEE